MALGGRYARLFTLQASAYTGEQIDATLLEPDGDGVADGQQAGQVVQKVRMRRGPPGTGKDIVIIG